MSTQTPVVALPPSSVLFGDVRLPKLRVLANGMPIAGVVSAEVTSNNHYAADRFRVDIATSADPSMGPAFWAGTASIVIDVQVSVQPAPVAAAATSWQSLAQGQVDLVDIDMVSRIARLEGRDFTAALIEARTQETFANRTSSEIATILAQRHGLTPQVTQTTTPVGQYYQLEHDRITLDQFSRSTTEWDLLINLAQHEGFDVFVQGTTLVFAPPTQQPDNPIVLRPVTTVTGPANILDLRVERSLTLARDIEVTVKSWNTKQQNAFTQTARASGQNGSATPSSTGPAQRYVFVRPNLTMDEALKLAQSKLAELTRHERTIIAAMPGELSLTPRSIVILEGTVTSFDQSYYVDEIERSISIGSGFTQRIVARNIQSGHQSTTPADTVGAVTG